MYIHFLVATPEWLSKLFALVHCIKVSSWSCPQMLLLLLPCCLTLLPPLPCCRCADRGVRVFRIWRDEQYLQTMMQLLAVLQTQHVLQGVQPTAATFSSIPSYAAFLRRTASLARSAVCIAAAGEEVTAKVPAAADGSNVERFW